MARHSLTVQVNPSLPGHVAVVVNEPSRQTYAGFGPEHHHRIYDKGQFDVHSVKSGATTTTTGDGDDAAQFDIARYQTGNRYHERRNQAGALVGPGQYRSGENADFEADGPAHPGGRAPGEPQAAGQRSDRVRSPPWRLISRNTSATSFKARTSHGENVDDGPASADQFREK